MVTLGFNLERNHAMTVRSLHDYVRADLWDRLGVDNALDHHDATAWVVACAKDQQIAGDRVRLYLPAWARVTPDAFTNRQRLEKRSVHLDTNALDAYTGRYLDSDLMATDHLSHHVWPKGYAAASVQLLALVALGAVFVARETGCRRAEAVAWLLCDEPIPAREIVAYKHQFLPAGGGLTVWVPDWRITAKRLGELYVSQRQWLRESEQRRKPPTERTGALIEYVERMHPHKGHHPDNMTWPEMVREWNNVHPAEWWYKDDETMQRAYRNARKRRVAIGYLPPKADGKGGEEHE